MENKNTEVTPEIVDNKFIISANREMSLVPGVLSKEQMLWIFQKTPQEHIYQRPAKGGGTWDFVTGVYVKKVLNFVFGFNWDFEIIENGREGDSLWVKGKLTVRTYDERIGEWIPVSKMQFGRADLKMKKDGSGPLDFGNDLKAAATDALKKCASEFGIASDIYGKNEFKDIQWELNISEASKEKIKQALSDDPDVLDDKFEPKAGKNGAENAR